jgi:hypothetical protein
MGKHMNMGSKGFSTRRPVGRTIISELILLACYISLPAVSFGAEPSKAMDPSLGMLSRVFPQQAAPVPSRPPTPITFGQTIAGTLTSNDNVLPGAGTFFDAYSVVTRAPNQSYIITATSPNVALFSDLRGTPPFGQSAFTLMPGQQVQYSGTLPLPGRYLIRVSSSNVQQPVGSYTLSLTHKPAPCPPAPAAP